VSAIKDETVLLDFNHPLAGKTLYFDLKVVNIHVEGNPARAPR
jgi:FKBP-type peptidyl-prolyl cis-trans isomerase SlyD